MGDMNRRNFFKLIGGLSVATIPLMGKTTEYFPTNSPVDLTDQIDDVHFIILQPYDIKKTWGEDSYVNTPCFQKNGKNYACRTWKLKLTATQREILTFGTLYNMTGYEWVKKQSIFEIKRLGLTHINSVRFNPVCIIDPYGVKYHCAYVRGATVKPS